LRTCAPNYGDKFFKENPWFIIPIYI
jgi:hypothetical protein